MSRTIVEKKSQPDELILKIRAARSDATATNKKCA